MRFVYLGGREFDGVEMPASVTLFGVRFVEDVPTEVSSAHAISKLKGNSYFRVCDEDGQQVQKRGRGRPPKLSGGVYMEPVPVTDENE